MSHMPIPINIGDRFGEWTVISKAGLRRGSMYWHCRCSCGNEGDRRATELRMGRATECGHIRAATHYLRGWKHGQYASPTYWSWVAMKARCSNPRLKHYKDYGGRGIVVCERWQKFENFVADMGQRPSLRHSIDRIDNDKGYDPSNCRWSTSVEQANNRRNTRWITHDGRTQTLGQWARECGVPYQTLQYRLNKGLAMEQISQKRNVRR
jgi:hypothetical protein